MNAQRPGSLWNRSMGGRPTLPVELVDMTEEEYRTKLLEFGWSEDAAEAELVLFRQYLESVRPKTVVKPVTKGPVKNKLYAAWKVAARSRRIREETPDVEEED